MATLSKFTNTEKAPMQTVKKADLKKLLIDTADAIRLRTYGARAIPGVSPPHDHGENGAELLSRPLLSIGLGPYVLEDAGILQSVLGTPTFFEKDPKTDFNTNFKILAIAPLFLPGGVTTLKGIVVATGLNSSVSHTIGIALRTLRAGNRKLEAIIRGQITKDITVSPPNGAHVSLPFEFSADDLGRVKSPQRDTELEIVLYQKSCPQPFSTFVAAIAAWTEEASTTIREPESGDPPLPQVTVSDLQAGTLLLTPLSKKAKGRLNAESHGLLGRAPGLGIDAVTVDTSSPWKQKKDRGHRHQGILSPTPSGDIQNDGAIVRYPPLFTQAYPKTFGENGLFLAGGEPVKGVKIHPNGAFDDEWKEFEFLLAIPAGLGSILLRLAAQPETEDPDGKLYLHAGIFRRGDTENIIERVSCGVHTAGLGSLDTDGLFVCQLDPEEDEVVWQQNAARQAAGQGLWTLDAESGKQNIAIHSESLYRWSQLVRIDIAHPQWGNNRSHPTARYVAKFRLRLNESSTTYDDNARLLCWHAFAAKGW